MTGLENRTKDRNFEFTFFTEKKNKNFLAIFISSSRINALCCCCERDEAALVLFAETFLTTDSQFPAKKLVYRILGNFNGVTLVNLQFGN